MDRKYILVMVALCGLAGASTGICFNTTGLFYTPIAADLGVGRAAVAMTNTICILVGSVSAVIVSRIVSEKTLRPIILISSFLMFGSTLLMAFVHSVWTLYFLNVLRGIGYGMTGFVLVAFLLNHWFVEKLGLMTSIAMAFSGVPGVVFSPVITSVINHFGWRTGYIFVAGLILLFDLPAILFRFTISPESMNMRPYGWKPQEKEGETLVKGAPAELNYHSSAFILTTAFAVLVASIAGIPQHFPSFAETVGSTAATGSLMLSFAMAANIASKLLFGTLVDRIGTRNSILFMALINIAATVLLLFVHARTALLAGAFFFTFTFCNSAVGIAMLTRDVFGTADYDKAYPVIVFIDNIFNAFAASFFGLLYDVTGAYTMMFVISLVLQCLAVLITLYIYRKIIRTQDA